MVEILEGFDKVSIELNIPSKIYRNFHFDALKINDDVTYLKTSLTGHFETLFYE